MDNHDALTCSIDYHTDRTNTATHTIQVITSAMHSRIKKAREQEKISMSPSDLIVYAVAKSLVAFPEFNAHFTNRVVRYERVDIGYLLNFGKGGKLAVLEDAGNKSVQELSRQTKELALQYIHDDLPEDKRSTFTVNILSSFDVFISNPLLVRGQVATVSVASEYDAVEVKNGVLFPVKKMNISLSYDIRVADCQKALAFLGNIKKLLENMAVNEVVKD